MIERWIKKVYNTLDGLEWFQKYVPDWQSFQITLLFVAIAIPLFLMILFLIFALTPGIARKQKPTDVIHSLRNKLNTAIEEEKEKDYEKKGVKSKLFKTVDVMVKAAGNPLQMNSNEWYALLIFSPLIGIMLVLMQTLYEKSMLGYFQVPVFSLVFVPSLLTSSVFLFLYLQARKRRHTLQMDFIRAFNRLGDLTHLNTYEMVRVALAGTRELRIYTPEIGEWNASYKTALDIFAKKVGIEEAQLFKRTIIYIREHPHEAKDHILRVDNHMFSFREQEEKKNLKALDSGFTLFIYIPFIVNVGALSLPWYQMLMNSFDRLLQ